MTGIIDGAIHVWDPNPDSPGHSAEELLATLDGAGVHGAVCIHSRRDSKYDHTATQRALSRYPDRLIGVCVVPPDSPTAADELRAHVDNGFKGVRILPWSDADVPWLDGPSGDPLWNEAAKLDVPVDIILRPEQLERVRARAVRSENATVIIDHMALITAEDPPDRLSMLRTFADLPNVVCKMSSLMHASREDFPHRDIHHILRAVVDAFGTDRVIYGSDWPNMLGTYPYDYAIRTIDEALGLSGGEREQLFGGTAARVWKIAPTTL